MPTGLAGFSLYFYFYRKQRAQGGVNCFGFGWVGLLTAPLGRLSPLSTAISVLKYGYYRGFLRLFPYLRLEFGYFRTPYLERT